MVRWKRIGGFFLALLLLFAFQQVASLLGGRAANAFGYAANDPLHPAAWISIHHVVQMALGLMAIWLVWCARRLDFRLLPKKDIKGVKCFAWFVLIVLVATVAGYRLMYPSGADIAFDYELNARNIAGMLGFQLLLSGPSEEILFRALPITILCAIAGGGRGGAKRWGAIVAAAALFSLAHISWYTDPFRLSFSWFQLGYSFLFGLAYGYAYVESGSVLYPMMMHSASNMVMACVGYAMRLWM